MPPSATVLAVQSAALSFAENGLEASGVVPSPSSARFCSDAGVVPTQPDPSWTSSRPSSFAFAQAEQRREAEDLITDEKLNADAAKRYIAASIKRKYASENGTELNSILPKMSPLNPQYLTKKRDVFQRISAFVEKFKGVGGTL